jgi:hypothetical protein
MKRHGKPIGIAMGCAALLLAAASWWVVRSIAVDFDALGVRVESVPEEARALLWARFGGEGEPRLPEDSSERLLQRVNDTSEAPDPPLRLAMTAAASEVRRGRDDSQELWRRSYGESVVRISRHWTATEALSLILGRAHYGHRFDGLEAAALGYYGREPAELTRAELASLVVTANRAVKFNPWCRPGENAEAVSQLLAGVESATGESGDPLARLRPVPDGKCPRR